MNTIAKRGADEGKLLRIKTSKTWRIAWALTIAIVSFAAILLYEIPKKKTSDLKARLAEFERTVADWKLQNPAKKPVRLVVYDVDRSAFATANVFEQILYDETDEIDGDPNALQGVWPSPLSSTGVTQVGWGRKTVERIQGHFYFVRAADR